MPTITKQRFNFEYSKLWREVALGMVLAVHKGRNPQYKNGKILIVIPCLIGEFAAAAPAIYDYIQRHPDHSVDLLVAPPCKELAQHITGIGTAYSTASNFGRSTDDVVSDVLPCEYEKVILLRISPKAYAIVRSLKVGETVSILLPVIGYLTHLGMRLTIGKIPKRWRTLNFDILGGVDRPIPFLEIFTVSAEEHESIQRFTFLKNSAKNILIHTGAKWHMKMWKNDNWIELLRKMHGQGNYQFIFIGSHEDVENHRLISAQLDFPTESIINKTSIFELTLVMQAADYFIGIDSGPSNLAHLVGLRSITLYGPGPHMFMSHDPDDIIIDKSSGRGIQQLFFSLKKSIVNTISVSEVYQAFLGLVTQKINH